MDDLDAAYMLCFHLEQMIRFRIPMTLSWDSYIYLTIIMDASVMIENFLMIFVRASREANQMGAISYVGCIRSTDNLADGFAKFYKIQLMIEFLEHGRWTTIVEEGIFIMYIRVQVN